MHPLQFRNFDRLLPVVEPPSRPGEVYVQNFMIEQQKTNASELQFAKFPFTVDIPMLENELQDRSVFWF